MYNFTHSNPPLIINPSREDILKYNNVNSQQLEDPFSPEFVDSYFGANRLITPIMSKTEEKPVKGTAVSYTPTKTEKEIKEYKHVPELSVNNIHKLSSTQINIGKDIIKYFENKGLSSHQAAGIAGNLFAESSFNTIALGDKGKSFGLAQWNNGRLKNLKNFAKSTNRSENNLATQLDFIWKELNTTEKNALDHLIKATDSLEASKAFAHKFERMKEYNNLRHEIAKFLHDYK